MRPGDIIVSNPGEGEMGLPDIFVNSIEDQLPMSEMTDKYNTLRDWETMHPRSGAGEGIKVGGGDTGVDKTHLEGDLKGCTCRDFTGSRHGYYDVHGHGTHTMIHMGGRKDGKGMFGAAPKAELYHAKVLGDRGSGSTTGIANGIKWMVDQGCHIINLSLGGGYSRDIERALIYAADNGSVVFASMGNSGRRGGGHPGTSRYSQGITAMDYNNRLASFSSRDSMAKYVGYGVQVLSGITRGRYGKMSGTSMSCPDVCGQAANIFSYMLKKGLTPPKSIEEYDLLVKSSIVDLGPEGHDKGYGLGFVDTNKVLDYIDTLAGPTPEPGPPTPSPEKKAGMGLVSTDDGVLLFSSYGDDATITVGNKTYKGKASFLT